MSKVTDVFKYRAAYLLVCSSLLISACDGDSRNVRPTSQAPTPTEPGPGTGTDVSDGDGGILPIVGDMTDPITGPITDALSPVTDPLLGALDPVLDPVT